MSEEKPAQLYRSHCRHGALLAICVIPALVSAQGISDIRIETPRDFGYTIGDKIRHEMYLSLSDPVRLDTNTLPEPGRLNRWLEISRAEAEVEYREQIAEYRIFVEYQIFNAPQQLTPVTIPNLEFITTGGEHPIPVFVPEWTFTIAPVTDADARQSLTLEADRQPEALPLTGRSVRLALWTLLLAAFLAYHAYLRILLPRLRRNRYPFSKAFDELRRLQRSESDTESYRSGLRAFHAAVNATAGQVVFTGNIDDFLSTNPKFAALANEIIAVYRRSQDVFFNKTDTAEPGPALGELVEVCRRCRALERAVA